MSESSDCDVNIFKFLFLIGSLGHCHLSYCHLVLFKRTEKEFFLAIKLMDITLFTVKSLKSRRLKRMLGISSIKIFIKN